jgi:AmmeMemoRadiSam system protein B
MGMGRPALEWVKNNNDAAFINAVLEGDPSVVLKRVHEDKSACSAGAVLGALGFCAQKGKNARLLGYCTSADDSDEEDVPDSFVGYAAISFG